FIGCLAGAPPPQRNATRPGRPSQPDVRAGDGAQPARLSKLAASAVPDNGAVTGHTSGLSFVGVRLPGLATNPWAGLPSGTPSNPTPLYHQGAHLLPGIIEPEPRERPEERPGRPLRATGRASPHLREGCARPTEPWSCPAASPSSPSFSWPAAARPA